MPQVQVNLNDEEDRVVELIKAHYRLKTKTDAIKKVLSIFGKKLQLKIPEMELK